MKVHLSHPEMIHTPSKGMFTPQRFGTPSGEFHMQSRIIIDLPSRGDCRHGIATYAEISNWSISFIPQRTPQ